MGTPGYCVDCCDEPEHDDGHPLLVDPVLLAAVPVAELGGLEPESNLLVGRLNRVT